MTLLLIEPENFTSLSNLIVAILSFLTSIGTLLLTYIMAKTAIKALDTWKHQKHYDIYVEASSKLPEIKRDFENLISELYHDLILKQINGDDKLIEYDQILNSELKKQGIYNIISKLEISNSADEKYIKTLKEYKKLSNEIEQTSRRIRKCLFPFQDLVNGAELTNIEILLNQVKKTKNYLSGFDDLVSKIKSQK